MKKFIFIFFAVVFISCGSNELMKANPDVNVKSGSEYRKTVKSFTGRMTKDEYFAIKKQIEENLNTSIPKNKSILINYFQKGKNCISLKRDDENMHNLIKITVNISNSISKKYNVEDFLVYSNDSFFKDKLSENKNFKLDTGFFSKNIFNLKENCQAFIIIKPNGKFMKHYGEDNFSEISNYFMFN